MADTVMYNALSDSRIAEKIGEYVRYRRIERNMSQDELAMAAGLSRPTISLMERGMMANINNLIKVLRALDSLYVFETFEVPQSLSPMQLLKLQEDQKKRSSKKRK